MKKKKPTLVRHHLPKKLIDDLKNTFGEQLEIVIEDRNEKGEDKLKYIYTNKLPKIKFDIKGRDIQVEMSSIENENLDLLNSLFPDNKS